MTIEGARNGKSDELYHMSYIFWLSIIALFYTYFGYPLYMFLRAKWAKNKAHKDATYKPSVSVVFSAYNEEGCIAGKIENLLSSDYPADRLELLVGSDGSNDRTNEILSRLLDKRVKIFIFPQRRGKISVVNDLVKQAEGEVLLFCDSRQTFERNAISALAANFADERVGCASGELLLEEDGEGTGVSTGVGIYWNYERLIRRCESAVGSMAGATGAIYAIRKNLYSAPPNNTILDDVYIPLAISRRGYRCIVDADAIAYDKPADTPGVEYRRKVRTLAGNYQIFAMFKDLFRPFNNPVFMPLFSHKFLRVIAPFFMIALFMSNIFIVKGAGIYTVFMVLQILFYGMAVIGTSVPYMFCVMNFAALAGLYRFAFGKQEVAWEK